MVQYIFLISFISASQSAFLTRLLKSGILFLTAVRAIVVANLMILVILFLTSLILALREAFVAKLVILGISFLTSFFWLSV